MLRIVYNFVLLHFFWSRRAVFTATIVTLLVLFRLPQRSIHFNFWRCNNVFLRVESIFNMKKIRDGFFSSLKLYNVNALLTFHNIHISFKPVRIITNNPFLFPTHEWWLLLYCWKTRIVYSSSIIIAFFFRERWIPLSLEQTHTQRELCTNKHHYLQSVFS